MGSLPRTFAVPIKDDASAFVPSLHRFNRYTTRASNRFRFNLIAIPDRIQLGKAGGGVTDVSRSAAAALANTFQPA